MVCVANGFHQGGIPSILNAGVVYKILEIEVHDIPSCNVFIDVGLDRWHQATLFKPVERDRSSHEVEKLKKLLNTKPVKETA